MESYALGKPVIGSVLGGIPELIREEETGVTFEPGSVENLASTLRYFADLTATRISGMGRAGRQWLETEYTATRYQERMLDLYSKVGVS